METVQAKELSGVILFQLTIHLFLRLITHNFDFCPLDSVWFGLLINWIRVWTKTNYSAICCLLRSLQD